MVYEARLPCVAANPLESPIPPSFLISLALVLLYLAPAVHLHSPAFTCLRAQVLFLCSVLCSCSPPPMLYPNPQACLM